MWGLSLRGFQNCYICRDELSMWSLCALRIQSSAKFNLGRSQLDSRSQVYTRLSADNRRVRNVLVPGGVQPCQLIPRCWRWSFKREISAP